MRAPWAMGIRGLWFDISNRALSLTQDRKNFLSALRSQIPRYIRSGLSVLAGDLCQQLLLKKEIDHEDKIFTDVFNTGSFA